MVNKVTLGGNLGADPEAKVTSGGAKIVNLRVATSRSKKEGDEWVEVTDWHRVVTFGKLADSCEKFLKKGRQVFVSGRIEYS